MCGAALGTDTFGSVRIPAAYNGQFGLKPAYGAISLDRVIAASSRMCWAVLDVIGAEPPQGRAGDPVVGLIADAYEPVAAALMARRITEAGLTTRPVTLPGYDHAAPIRRALLIAEAEAFSHHRQALADYPEDFGAAFRAMLAWGGRQSPERKAGAHMAIDTARACATAALAGIDVLLLPAVPAPGLTPHLSPVPHAIRCWPRSSAGRRWRFRSAWGPMVCPARRRPWPAPAPGLWPWPSGWPLISTRRPAFPIRR